MGSKEANITINGVMLTPAQSMIIRLSVESFDADLTSEGLFDDEHGKSLCRSYQRRVSEIRKMLYSSNERIATE